MSQHRLRHFRGAFRPLLLYGRSGRLNDWLRFMAGSQNRQGGDEQNPHSLKANNFLLFRDRDPAYLVWTTTVSNSEVTVAIFFDLEPRLN